MENGSSEYESRHVDNHEQYLSISLAYKPVILLT